MNHGQFKISKLPISVNKKFESKQLVKITTEIPKTLCGEPLNIVMDNKRPISQKSRKKNHWSNAFTIPDLSV